MTMFLPTIHGMMVKRRPVADKPRVLDPLHRVVIPVEVRERLGLQAGDYVVFEVEGGRAYLTPVEWKKRT